MCDKLGSHRISKQLFHVLEKGQKGTDLAFEFGISKRQISDELWTSLCEMFFETNKHA